MNAIVGTGKRGKTGVKTLGIAGILCLAVVPVFGATAGAGAREGEQSPPPGAASLAEHLDEAVYSLPASQPAHVTEDIQVQWGTGQASKLQFVPALVDSSYLGEDEGTSAGLSEETVAEAQAAAVLASLAEEPGLPDATEVLLARVNLDTEASSAGNGSLRVAWGEEPAPSRVLVRTMSRGMWTPWVSLQADESNEGTALLETEAVSALEILAVPVDAQAGDVWVELQTAVRPVENVLAELLPVTPVDPEPEEGASEEPPATDGDELDEETPGAEDGDKGTDEPSDTEEGGGESEESPGTEEPGQSGESEEPSDTEEPVGDGAQSGDAVEVEITEDQVLGEAEEVPELVSAIMAPLSARVLSTQMLSMANAVANWNPGFILSDATMYTPSRMTEAQIKTFIETVGKNCKSAGNNKCLKDQTVTNLSLKSDFASKGWGCKALSIPGTVPAWTAIKKVADACSINPEVLLVFIQKESSGLSQALSISNWNKMMGVGCPDSKPCDTAYSGFTNQLYYSADWLGSYRYRGFYFNEAVKTGKPVVVNNSSTYGASCGTQTFVMRNQATASLYTYNPAVPTKTALESWPGVSGLKCDSYGQRNVYMMMLQWFPGSMQDRVNGQSGWVQSGGSWYYFSDSGVMQTGWLKLGNTWYYLNTNGVMQTGWLQIGATWYFLDSSGAMKTGWLQIGPTWYYLTASGAMNTGWIQVGSNWYYMTSSGAMKTGWIQTGSSKYYLSSSGAMKTGWLKQGDDWYFLSSSGAAVTGWLDQAGARYFMQADGVMKTGWLKQGSSWYLFSDSGAMRTNWARVGGAWYFINPDGVMRTGWLWTDNQWYFLGPSGVMHTGWLLKSGVWYYLDAGGAMATGEQVIDGRTSEFSESGAWLGYVVTTASER